VAKSVENYISQNAAALGREQAIRVWTAGLVVVLIAVIAMLLAPLMKAADVAAISSPLYKIFGFICHQIPDRSLYVTGERLAVCSRCFGVYCGLLAGLALYPLWRNIAEAESPPRVWLFASLAPIAIDWSLTFFGVWENTHVSRVVTGLILGFACATFIFPALVETIRNLTRRRPAPASHAPPNLY
jgi:uncharacterized membrane protein